MLKNAASSKIRESVILGVRTLLLIVVGFALWNGRLLWSVSKPLFITYGASPGNSVPALTSTQLNQDQIIYPRLGITAPLANRPNSSPLVWQDWKQLSSDLKQGVNLSYTGKEFTQAPYAYVVGHSSDTYPHPYSSVFAGLGQARLGDSFTLVVDKQAYTYTVTGKKEAYPTDVSAFIPTAPASGKHEVLLVTCWPLLTTKERLILTAIQVN